MKKPDIYMLTLRIPHYKTRMAVSEWWRRWSEFFTVMADARFERCFRKRHRWLEDRKQCKCGFQPRPDVRGYEDELDSHLEYARSQEWDKRRWW